MFFGGSDHEDDGFGFSAGMPSQGQGSGSRLSSLFGGGPPPEGNESLIYRPQKQPSKQKEPPKQAAASADTPALLFATACHAYKFVNGQYASQGKLGAAVLGHLESKDYKLLLYAAQKKPVTNAKIHQAFKFNVQKNNYATFYDDQSQNWSLCFDNASQLAEFAKWVGFSCYNIAPGNLALQDLNIADGQEVQKGDTVEMKYTGWLHAGSAFGKVFDSNESTEKLFKFKIGKGKVIKGWDTGIIGMKKGSKRLLVIPPQLAYAAKGAGERVPPNSTLIFQVELTRIKFANPQPEADNVSMMSVDVAVTPTDQPKLPQTPVKDDQQETFDDTNESMSKRTQSISEQLSKTPDTKTKLLERMSKMGKAMIPNPVRTTSQEGEETEQVDGRDRSRTKSMERNISTESNVSESPRPQLKPKPSDVHHQHSSESTPTPDHHHQQPAASPQMQQQQQQQPQYYPHNPQSAYAVPMQFQQQPSHNQMFAPQPQQQLALYQSPQSVQSSMFQLPQHMQQQVNATPPTANTAPAVTSTEISLIVSEGKLQHSEVKSELTRLMDKLDNVQTRLVAMEASSNFKQVALPQQGPEMEANVLMQNITRIIKENEKLSLECEEKGKKIEKLNESMTDLLTKNQSFFEKSNQLLASQSDSLQHNAAQAMAKVSLLEDRNIQLDSELSSTRTQLLLAQKKEETFEEKTVQMTITIENLQKELKNTKDKAESADTSVSETEVMIEELKKQNATSKKENKQLKLKLNHMEEEFGDSKMENEATLKTLNDLKKKRTVEKSKHEDEMEEMKNQHEEELKNLKKRYSKNASGEAEKLSQLEDELTQTFEDRMKKKMKDVELKHNEQLDEIKKNKMAVDSELVLANSKIDRMREELGKDYDEKLQEANEQHKTQLDDVNQETKSLKEALQTLQNKIKDGDSSNEEMLELRSKLDITTSEKEKLEEQWRSIQEQNNSLGRKVEDITLTSRKEQDAAYNRGLEEGRSTVKTISQVSYDKGFNDGKTSVNVDDKKEDTINKDEITAEVKKVMNNVFFKLKGEFEAEDDYSGTDVVKTILNVVREVTLKLTQEEENDENESESESELSEDESDEEEQDDDDEESEGEEIGRKEQSLVESTLASHHPAEEGGEKTPDQGLDVTGQASFDEVDVKDNDVEVGKSEKSETEKENEDATAHEDVAVEEDSLGEDEDHVDTIEENETKEDLSSQVEDQLKDSEQKVENESEDGPLKEERESEDDDITEDLVEAPLNKAEDPVEKETEDGESLHVEDPLQLNEELEKNNANIAVDDTSVVEVEEEDVQASPLDIAASDDDDDGSFTSAQSEPIDDLDDDVENVVKDEIKSESSSQSALEQVGLDKSIFGVTEVTDGDSHPSSSAETSRDLRNDEEMKPGVESKEDESALFFGTAVKKQVEAVPEKDKSEAAVKENKGDKEVETKKSSLFFEDESDDDDDFFKPKDKSDSTTKASAFSRSPPPLFGDDDDDTNWI